MLIPFDYLDTVCFAASSREHGISSAPVWQLHVTGDFDEQIARRAVEALTRRYPILISRAVSLQGKGLDASRRLAYEVDPTPDLDALFQTIDLSGPDDGRFAALQQQLFDHFIDMEHDYPARFTWIRRGATSGVLMMQQHHGIADGRAFFDLVDDLCTFYDHVLTGTLPSEIVAVPKVPEAHVAEPVRRRRFWRGLAGFFMHLRNIVRYGARPLDPLVCNLPADFTGPNRVRHLDLDEAVQARLHDVRRHAGFSTNDVLTAALALALARWSAENGHPVRRFNVLVPTDMRPREGSHLSFANHLSSFLVDFDLARCSAPLAVLASVHRQIRRQAARRAPVKKVLAEIWVARRVALGAIRKAVFAPRRTMLNFPFSNLIPISPTANGGRFATRAWMGDDVRIMTPCAWLQAVNTTVIRYGGRLCFNFNYKASAIAPPLVEAFIATFEQTLEALVSAALEPPAQP